MTDDPLIERLRAARSRPSVLKIRWLGFNFGKRFRRVLVVEGKEDKVVYGHWMRRLGLEPDYEFFVAGGKKNALKIREFIDHDIDSGIYILVDSDFDDNSIDLSEEIIYVLPRYSIENYLVCPNVLQSCLQSACDFDGHPEVREEICRIFEADFDRFLEVSSEWNRRIFFARRLGVNIDDAVPDALNVIADVKFADVTRGNGDPEEIFDFEKISEDERNNLDAIFQTLAPRYQYRGKFALKFLKIWLSSLHAEMRDSASEVIVMPPGSDLKVTWDEFTIGSLASRSQIPEGLDLFLSFGTR